ncbi:SDR family oxidoreductase [Alcaligenaceae bacterium]|nr:SDR family oxidoreductase [Alcaligenaceae bacterium]
MEKLLQNRIAIVVGGGQTPGLTIGNGRATALSFAREGATVVVVDREMQSAQETVDQILAEGGQAWAAAADISREGDIRGMVAEVVQRHGRIDILHNNVGMAAGGGDQPIDSITEEAFDHLYTVNLRGMAMTCKHVLAVMDKQQSGNIINISSIVSVAMSPNLAYKVTKMGVLGLTQHIAMQYAAKGIRANAILPGLLDTPMAIETRVRLSGKSREQIIAERNAQVPLRGHMGSAWDVANAAVFLASDRAAFITGINLPVDGGAMARIGG